MPPVAEFLAVEEKADFAFRNAKASLEIEGQSLPEGAEDLILENVRGEISDEEFFKRALEIARNV